MSDTGHTTNQATLNPEQKKTVGLVFLTIFLDLVGFSIIFPLFPAMISHYVASDPSSLTLNIILGMINNASVWFGMPASNSNIVLFGGILGALYSLLQFIFAPIWGALSDRIGRRPVLIISVFGTLACYALWFMSSHFDMLVLSRVIAGMMAGNLSTATASVSDVTTEHNRSRGMAMVGMAFGLGFIFGPAIGGLSSLVRLDLHYPQLLAWGVNPFSMPALIAFVVGSINFVSILINFRETLPATVRRQTQHRSLNPLASLFAKLPIGVSAISAANLFFLIAFSGMEFTLTFLAHEKFGFSAKQNGFMFVYIGLLIAFVQGGFVRRKAAQIGEARLALGGMASLFIGFVILGQTATVTSLYISLAFLAAGAACVIPCLSSLVSFCATRQTQGQALGQFRSMGALARVLGPLYASLTYWRFGASATYHIAIGLLLIPVTLIATLGSKKTQVA